MPGSLDTLAVVLFMNHVSCLSLTSGLKEDINAIKFGNNYGSEIK